MTGLNKTCFCFVLFHILYAALAKFHEINFGHSQLKMNDQNNRKQNNVNDKLFTT